MENTLRAALLQVGERLRTYGYQFTAVTPESHRRVLSRPVGKEILKDQYQLLRHFFGWNRPVRPEDLPQEILEIMQKFELLVPEGEGVKSLVRFATLGSHLFVHSAFPTTDESSVFFGPDSYRFVRFLKQKKLQAKKVLDIGCGSGVGGISFCDQEKIRIFCDVNPQALHFAEINARLNGCERTEFYSANILDGAPKGADLIIANPPFIMDERKRQYRNGGGDYGAEIALKIVQESCQYLDRGGRLALYTGSSIVDGQDIFRQRLEEIVSDDFEISYEEIDPDIFGEELSLPLYQDVERISAVGLVLTRE